MKLLKLIQFRYKSAMSAHESRTIDELTGAQVPLPYT